MRRGNFFTRFSTLILSSLLLCRPSLADEKNEYGLEFWPGNGKAGDDDQISWKSIFTQEKAALGRAKQVNFFIDACYAGQAIVQSDPSVNTNVDLAMPYTMSVATPADRLMRFGYSSDDSGNGRIQIGDYYYYSFNDYLTKRLKTNSPVPTVKQLFDSAKADVIADNDIPEGRNPDFVKRGGGDDALKIKGDAAKSRTLMFGGYMEDMYPESHDESYKALQAYNFDSSVMYRNAKAQDLTRDPPIQGKGTWGNFKTALGDLKTQLAAGGAQTQMINIFNVSHGYEKELNDDKESPTPGVKSVHEGHIIAGTSNPDGDRLDIAMSPQFWDTLKASLFPTSGDPMMRVAQPRLTLAYSEQSVTQPFDISVGGVSLGTVALDSPDPSGQLVVPLEDSVLAQLITSMDGASQLTMQFNLAVGDSIRVGMEDDLYNDPTYLSYTYGVGISTVVTDAPEPVAVGLVASVAMFSLMRRRRHAK